MVPTNIQVSTHIHRFIDRWICHCRYRHRPSIHLQENTVDIDIDRRSTYGRYRHRSSIHLRENTVDSIGSLIVDKISSQFCGRFDRRQLWNFPRPCSPVWDKWNVSSGQTPCPCPTCPTKIWGPPSPCSTCPTKIWRPPSPCSTCPTTPTCPNLSHLVVPLVLCQVSSLRFFFGFLSVIPFFEKHFWMKSFLQSTVMVERV